jgi:regulator of protease activity HflC (stomatin/prohibitin superfamily)
VAAPDRIAESIGGALNYQFGFDVTGSWFYQLLTRSLTVLVLVGLVVMWALTGVGVVQPNEQGLRIRFGAQVGGNLGPGAYLKLPWPLERIERFDTATARRVDLGGEQPKVKTSILWTNDHGVTEGYFVVRPSAADVEAGREMASEKSAAEEVATAARTAGMDVSLVSAEVPLLFEVTDLSKYEQLAAPDQREQMLKAIAQREVFTYLATQTVDSVLGRGRTEISSELRKRVDAKLTAMDCGVRVLHVAIEGVHPPKDTAELFEGVVQSLQKRQGSIETGITEANRQLISVAGSVEMAHKIVEAIDAIDRAAMNNEPAAKQAELELSAQQLLSRAEGEAAAKLQAAKAERWTKHMAARGKAERYQGRLASYRASPAVYTARLYFDVLADVIKGSRVYIVSDDGDKLEVRTDVMDAAASGNLFDTNRKTEE